LRGRQNEAQSMGSGLHQLGGRGAQRERAQSGGKEKSWRIRNMLAAFVFSCVFLGGNRLEINWGVVE